MGKQKIRSRRAKFYIDECVPDWVMVHLWGRGYNAHLSKDDLGPSTDDSLLLKQAKKQGRVFVTLDKGKDIRGLLEGQQHPGIIVIAGDKLDESYVCRALDALLQWRARTQADYQNLYISVSEGELSIYMEDGKTLIIGSNGSLALREKDGSMCRDRRVIDQYFKTA